jgi:hypothetical protein
MNGCGVFPFSNEIKINKHGAKDVTGIQIQGTICSEGSTVLKAEGGEPGDVYEWFATSDDENPVFSSESNEFETPVIDKSRSYYVSIQNSYGCKGPKKEVFVEVNHFDEAEVINIDGVLSSNYSTGNQWYLNGEVLLEETNQTLKPDQSGLYAVEVEINGCTTRDEYEFLITGFERNPLLDWSYYPNPVVDELIIKTSKSPDQIEGIYVTNSIGVKVGEITLNSQGIGRFDMKSMSSGIYIIKILGSGKSVNFKVIKR